MYIPHGFGSVTPYFFVADAEAFVTFLVGGLGVRDAMGNIWWVSQRLVKVP
jgi:hypothetical protein